MYDQMEYCYIQELKKNPLFAINIFDRQIDLILHEDEQVIPRCGACVSSMGITPEGNLVGCSTLTGTRVENECIIGTLNTDINKFMRNKFMKYLVGLSKYEECRSCNYYRRCYYYCPSTNYLSSKNMFNVAEKQCEINKIVIRISEKIIYKMNKIMPDTFNLKFI